MSRPRHKLPLLSALAAGLLPVCALAIDPPTGNGRSLETALTTSAAETSRPQLIRASDLPCLGCEWKPALEHLPPTPVNLGAKPAPSANTGGAEAWSSIATASPRAISLRTLPFQDNEPLINRLKRVQAWPLLTIWDSSAATLYVGLDKRGEPGVHLRQKRGDRGSLLAPGRFVLIASPAARQDGPQITTASR